MTEVAYPEHLDQDGKDLIKSLLERDPDRRPKFEGIEAHSWMEGVEFSPLLKEVVMPNWIIRHAAVEAQPKILRRSTVAGHRNHKMDSTLSGCIQDICTQMIDVGNKTEAENVAARWLTDPSHKTVELFQGWNYVSDEAKTLELKAIQNRDLGFLDRIRSRRGTSDF